MSEWQPIETAPRDGTEVLLWGGDWESEISRPYPNCGVLVGYSKSGMIFTVAGGSHYEVWINCPTHWMPLPDPPQ